MPVNHKRVLRIMREDNLLAIRYRKYILTTNALHDCPVSLNLAARISVTGINQLWVADITYIRLHSEFVFLAVVIDRYSRKAVGWALDRSCLRPGSNRCAATGDRASPAATRSGPSLRPGHPVCQRRVHRAAASQPDDSEHEPARQPVR